MGDVRFRTAFEKVAAADRPLDRLAALSDEDVVAALAGAPPHADAYLVNVIASEAMNRVRRKSSIVETAEEGLVSLDDAGHLTYANPAAERMLGWSQSELKGRRLHDVVHTHDAQGNPIPFESCAVLRAVQDGGRLLQHEDVLTHKDGSRFPVSLTAAPLVRDGILEGIVVTFTDTTDRKEAEAARALLASIVEGSDDAILSKDLDARITSWNPGAERLYGYTQAEAIGNSVGMLVPEWRRGEEIDVLKRVMTGERLSTYETERVRKDGSVVHVSLTASPLYDAHGKVVGAAAIARDVTARKHAEAELQRSREELERILERIGDAFFALDREWRFTYVNREFERVLERLREDLLGRTLWDAYPEVVGTTFEREYRHALRARTSVHFEEYYPPLEAWFGVTAYASEEGLSVFFRDVTEKRRMDEALRASEAKYRSLFESIPDPVVVANTDRLIIAVNAAFQEAFGYTQEEVQGRTTEFLYESAERYAAMGEDMRRHKGPGAYRHATRMRAKDGRTFPVDVRSFHLRDGAGAVDGFIGYLRVRTTEPDADHGAAASGAP